jgi:hypothetical protein
VAAGGLCAVTWRPDALAPALRAGFDVRIVALSAGRATIATGGAPPRPFNVGRRRSAHVRHRHKYAEATLAPHHRFFFRTPAGLTGRSAGNIEEFLHELSHLDPQVLLHHAAAHDFSGWFAAVFQDRPLAARVRALEDGSLPAEELRAALALVVGARYGPR